MRQIPSWELWRASYQKEKAPVNGHSTRGIRGKPASRVHKNRREGKDGQAKVA